jgi:hypothetical protein
MKTTRPPADPPPIPPAPPRAACRRRRLLPLATRLWSLIWALAPSPARGAERAPAPGPPAARQDIRRPSGLAQPDRQWMALWHRRYALQAAPVKKALGELLEARRLYRPHQLGPECRRLRLRLRAFWRAAEEEDLFPVADTATDYHLKHLYRQIDAAAGACLAGRWGACDGHLLRAGRAFRQARQALDRWDLEP